MVNFDEIEFLESEIVDDDENAPVGTLINVTEDGKVEEVKNERVDAPSAPVLNEQSDDNTPSDDEDSSNTDGNADVESTQNVIEDNNEDVEDEQTALLTTDVQEDAPYEVESSETDSLSNEPSIASKQAEVEDVAAPLDETPTPLLVEEREDENLPTIEQPVSELAHEDEPKDEELVAVAPVAELEEVAPLQNQEPVAIEQTEPLTSEVNKQANDSAQEVGKEAQEPAKEVKKPAAKTIKPRKPAQKKEVAPTEKKDEPHKTSLILKGGKSVNDALFDTNFEVEKPAKTTVVSTKKKQEKAEDLWAVATLTKPKKETAPKAEDAKAEEKPAAKEAKATKTSTKTAPKAQTQSESQTTKKTAAKKSTSVENTSKSTEAKKVAKTTDKTTKTAQTEDKPVKATKTAKPVKDAAPKATPVKEEKAPKAATVNEKDEETVLVEGEGKTHGKYVIKKTDKGNFVFKLFSSNHRVVAIGAQAYTTLGAAKIGVQSIINNAENAPVENQTLKNYETEKFPKWEIYLDKKGEYRLRLFATNGNLIATTNDGYADISGAKNGIAAVARASKGCAIVRNDNLW